MNFVVFLTQIYLNRFLLIFLRNEMTFHIGFCDLFCNPDHELICLYDFIDEINGFTYPDLPYSQVYLRNERSLSFSNYMIYSIKMFDSRNLQFHLPRYTLSSSSLVYLRNKRSLSFSDYMIYSIKNFDSWNLQFLLPRYTLSPSSLVYLRNERRISISGSMICSVIRIVI